MNIKTVLFFSLLLICSSMNYAQEHHFITDENYRNQTQKMFEVQKKSASKRAAILFDVFNQNLTTKEREALTFLYAYMPLSDLADYTGDFYLQNIKVTFEASHFFSWGKSIPELIFRHFVLPCRVNNENMDTARIVFYKELKDRVKNLSMKEAVLEINHWCHEKVAYQGCDSRTSSPLATIKNALGRCGEESTFTVAAMRSVGIPARQCYTPRWAHSDDNHTWVEVWVDGKWHFLGACEPEPDLDLGWFAAPSKRTMMVNTTVFGYYLGEEEVLHKDDRYTRINLLENYAPVKTIYVKVLDINKKPIDSANVEFGLYNYAEFYPIGVKLSDKKGIASLKTGYGDLLIWATKNNIFGFEKVTVETNDTVVIILNRNSKMEYTLNFDITPPIPREIEVNVSDKQRELNNQRLKYEDSIRKAYENTFADSIFCYNLSNVNGLEFNRTYSLLKKSRGNWQEIATFINITNKEYKKYCLPLLEAISEKDLHDVTVDVLSDHLYNSKLSDKMEDDITINFIMNPRIGDEMIKPYKLFIQKYFSDNKFVNVKEIADWITKNIKIDKTANYYRLPITPKGSIELGVCDPASRDLLFVAICRSVGIPSRLEPATKIPQYYYLTTWNDMVFEKKENEVKTPKSSLILLNDKANGLVNPEYAIHFTIQKFKDGKYLTLDYEMDKRLKTFPCQLSVDAGDYLMVTGNRMQDGSVLTSLKFFSLKPKETKSQTITLRKTKKQHKVITTLTGKETFKRLNDDTLISINGLLKNAKGIVIWIESGKEPTRHAIVDISKLKANFEKWGGSFVLVLPENLKANFDKNILTELPSQTQVVVDNNNILKVIETTLKTKLSTDLPVVTIINEKGEVIYLSKGYKIGTGEQLLKMF
jgi:transglutaminase-like putative cysteine protease